ncbi:hypothetical protein AGLY_009909 [Aphis glycines]|uniref:Uncharacterized protein n=1 Tax=Aphis glycines TaxID=307491 RepID=A0A6G0TGR9_APHGL|nr:hypothetical protein AGLY_009909 [Aphis glycines]
MILFYGPLYYDDRKGARPHRLEKPVVPLCRGCRDSRRGRLWIRIPRAGRPVSAGAGDAVAGAVAATSRRDTVAAAVAAVAVVVAAADPATPSATTWDACCSLVRYGAGPGNLIRFALSDDVADTGSSSPGNLTGTPPPATGRFTNSAAITVAAVAGTAVAVAGVAGVAAAAVGAVRTAAVAGNPRTPRNTDTRREPNNPVPVTTSALPVDRRSTRA